MHRPTDTGRPAGTLRIALVDPHPRRQTDAEAARLGYAPPQLRSPVPRDAGPLLQTRGEGWALVDFTVDACGRVQGADVVASSGEPRFDRAARLAARTWTFRPALVCGRLAVPACCRLLLRVVVEEAGGAGRAFRLALEQALGLVHSGADGAFVRAVESELATLAERPAERAHLALLRADVHRMRGDAGGELEALHLGLERDGLHLAEAVRTLALQRVLRLELEAGLGDAVRRTADGLRSCPGPLAPVPVAVADAIEAVLDGEAPDADAVDAVRAWRLPWFDQVLLADPCWITPADDDEADVPLRVVKAR